ncbi:SCF ubiquitin ligase complex subunit cdc4, partial [Actinomortierella ambigua]
MSSEKPTDPAGASAGTPAASHSVQNLHARPPTTTTTSSTTTRGQPISASFSLAPMTTTTVVTTTTTTSTEYPPLVFKAPLIPGHLDPRLFPLADTPTPHALKKFCFDLNGQPTFFHENHEGEQAMGQQLEDALCNLSASAHQSAVLAFTDEKLRQRSLYHHHQHAQEQHQLPLDQQQHSHQHHHPNLNEEHTTTRVVSAGKGNGKSIVTTTTRKTVIAPRTILHPPGTTLLYGARKRPASPNTPVTSSNASASAASNSMTSHSTSGSSASASSPSSSSAHAVMIHDRLLNKDRASPPHKKTKVPDRNEPTHPTALLSSSSSTSSTARLAPSASAPSVSAFVTPSAPHRPRLHTTSHIGGSATAVDGTTTPASAMSAISSTSSFVDSTNLPSPSLSPTTAHQAGIGSSSSTTTTVPQAGESSAAGSIRRFTASHPTSMYRDAENDAMDNDNEPGYPFGTMLDHHHQLHHRYQGDDTHLERKDELEEEDEDVDNGIKSTEARLEDALDEERRVIEESSKTSMKALTKASHSPSLMDLPALVQTYDALPASLQSYMLFQLLRRSPAPTLQFVSSVILNTMKYDFLALLPVELRLNVLKYLDAPSLCAAAQVSKTWRVAVDSDAHIWMNRIQKDGFLLYDNEEKEAQSQQLGIDGHYGPRPSYHTRMELMKRRQAKGKGRFQYPVTRPTDLPQSPQYLADVTMKGDDDNGDTEMVAHEGVGAGGGAGGSSGVKSEWDSDTAAEDVEPMDETYAAADAAPPSPTTSHTGRQNADYDSEDEMMEEDIETSFGPMEPSTPHSYKALYRRHWLIRQNWAKGRAKYIKFSGHSDRVVTCL